MQQTAADAVQQLVESKNSADDLKSELNATEKLKEKFKPELERIENINKRIEEVIALYLGKVDERQGITRNNENSVMTRINEAKGYVQSRQTGITATERSLIEKAENELENALRTTNSFFTGEWSEFRKEMEKIDLPKFKEVKTFSLN